MALHYKGPAISGILTTPSYSELVLIPSGSRRTRGLVSNRSSHAARAPHSSHAGPPRCPVSTCVPAPGFLHRCSLYLKCYPPVTHTLAPPHPNVNSLTPLLKASSSTPLTPPHLHPLLFSPSDTLSIYLFPGTEQMPNKCVENELMKEILDRTVASQLQQSTATHLRV